MSAKSPSKGAGELRSRVDGLVESRASRVEQPALSLSVEAGPDLLGTGGLEERHYTLPEDARSVTIRDEQGTIRAHLELSMMESGALCRFDRERLWVVVDRVDRVLRFGYQIT